MRTFIVLALAIAVSALPQDITVPEVVESDLQSELIAPSAGMYMPAAAHKDAKDLRDTIFAQQGAQGANACKDLAKSAEDEVTAATKTAQDLLNKIDNGDKCKDAGQGAVTAAKSAQAAADEASKAAVGAYNSALKTKISWTDIEFDSITEGNCQAFFNAAQWTSAKAKVAAAKKKKEQASGALKAAITAIATAETQALKLAGECACKAQKDAKAATVASNNNLVSTNTKAWTKAAHLLCVLNGKSAKDCAVADIPQVTQPKMAAGVTDLCSKNGVVNSQMSKGLKISDLKQQGWTQCWTKVYSAATQDKGAYNLMAKCAGKQILEGCGKAGSDILKVSARGLKTDVFNNNCNTKKISGGGAGEYHVANGIGWFCKSQNGSQDYSHIGFISAKDINNVKLNNCAGTPGGMCLHTWNGDLRSGYSCDGDTGTGGHQAYWFYKN